MFAQQLQTFRVKSIDQLIVVTIHQVMIPLMLTKDTLDHITAKREAGAL
jgi:hypothetical protein